MATVPIPMARHVRITREAISPRLAMKIFRMAGMARPRLGYPGAGSQINLREAARR
jgi:hypothetical protein